VPSDQVDLLTLDKAYYLEPDSASPKAYVLLRKTLEQTDRTAIVRFSLRQKTRLAALRVRGDVLVLQTLLWADEVREAAFPALDETVRISAKELELSASLVESFASDFDPSEFTDEYQEELRILIDAKLEKGDALDTSETFGDHEEEDTGGEVIDLMEALRASVEKSRAAREGGATSAKKDDAPAKKPAAKKSTAKSSAAASSAKGDAKKSTAKKPAAKKTAKAS
jgi:DNA end-binding protein Ku